MEHSLCMLGLTGVDLVHLGLSMPSFSGAVVPRDHVWITPLEDDIPEHLSSEAQVLFRAQIWWWAEQFDYCSDHILKLNVSLQGTLPRLNESRMKFQLEASKEDELNGEYWVFPCCPALTLHRQAAHNSHAPNQPPIPHCVTTTIATR